MEHFILTPVCLVTSQHWS